jgi:hypothetical protein
MLSALNIIRTSGHVQNFVVKIISFEMTTVGGTMFVYRSTYISAMKMETTYYSETYVDFERSALRCIQEVRHLQLCISLEYAKEHHTKIYFLFLSDILFA